MNNNRICVTLRTSQENVEDKLGKDFTDEQEYALIMGEVEEVNKKLPAFKKINKVIIRKRPFDVTTAMKIRRFVKDNRRA